MKKLTKNQMANEIICKVESTQAIIVRTYGVCMGVGYDFNLYLHLKDNRILKLLGHANRNGWAYPHHLRPNNPQYKYTGSNDIYNSRVIAYLENKSFDALKSYLLALSYDSLEDYYNYVCHYVFF